MLICVDHHIIRADMMPIGLCRELSAARTYPCHCLKNSLYGASTFYNNLHCKHFWRLSDVEPSQSGSFLGGLLVPPALSYERHLCAGEYCMVLLPLPVIWPCPTPSTGSHNTYAGMRQAAIARPLNCLPEGVRPVAVSSVLQVHLSQEVSSVEGRGTQRHDMMSTSSLHFSSISKPPKPSWIAVRFNKPLTIVSYTSCN